MKKRLVIFISLLSAGISQAQNVGVGASAPAAKLDIRGTAASPSIPGSSSTGILRIGISSYEGVDIGKMGIDPYASWIQSGFNGSSADPLSLQPLGGNVGIGTTSPLYPLDVTGSLGRTGNFVNTGNSGLMTGIYGEAASPGTGLRFGLAGFGGAGETNIGVKGFASNGTTAYGVYASAEDATYNWAGYFESGDVYIQNKLGLGTVAPAAKLQVHHSSSQTTPQLLLYETASNNYSRLNFQNASGSTYWAIAGYNNATNANERLNFYNSTAGDIMSITGNGRVGIGTTNPSSTLDVTGNLSTSGNFVNTGSNLYNIGLHGSCSNGELNHGVYGQAIGGVHAFGVKGTAVGGGNLGNTAYGVYGFGEGGTNAIGVYGDAVGGTFISYAGYFHRGDVYITNNLGIGGIPTTKLHVHHNSTQTTPQLLLYESAANNYSRLNFQNASGSSYWAIAGYNDTTNANERLNFYNSTSGDLMSIAGNGFVGIGTSSPTSKLQVVGLPVYADNGAALGGGLTVGAFYRTATGVVMVVF